MPKRIPIEFNEQLLKDYVTIIETPRREFNELYLQRQEEMIMRQFWAVITAEATELYGAEEVEGKPRFDEVFCSSCGESFGPGDSGFSHCESHAGLKAID